MPLVMLMSQPKPKLRCNKCRREVERLDLELRQCMRCNADELHELGRQMLMDSLPLAQARRLAITEVELMRLERRGY
jgi:Zn finger protein HypA/HybF involved in hydrogenase expression